MAGFHVWAFATKIEFRSQEFKVYGEEGGFHLMDETTFYEILSMWTAAESDGG